MNTSRWASCVTLRRTALLGSLLMASILFACRGGGERQSNSEGATLDADLTAIAMTPVNEALSNYAGELCVPLQTIAEDIRNQDPLLADIEATAKDTDEALRLVVQHFKVLLTELLQEADKIVPPPELETFHAWYLTQIRYLVEVEQTIAEAQRSGLRPTPPPTPALPEFNPELVRAVLTAFTQRCSDELRELSNPPTPQLP